MLKISTNPPSIEEITEESKRLKNFKSPGADTIHPELLKSDPSICAYIPSLRENMGNRTIPSEWNLGITL